MGPPGYNIEVMVSRPKWPRAREEGGASSLKCVHPPPVLSKWLWSEVVEGTTWCMVERREIYIKASLVRLGGREVEAGHG
jgi:hypothetical protein